MAKVNRIFVGNLPMNITEKDVETEFSAYGTVTKVEVKNKTDPLTNDVLSTFAFVTISVTDSNLNQCNNNIQVGLTEFKNEKYRGRYLLVSVARENFMEKLKREREESSLGSNLKSTTETSKSPTEQQPKIKQNVQVKQTDSSDNDSSDSSTATTEASNNKSEPRKIMQNVQVSKPDSSDSDSSDSTTSKSSHIEPEIVVKRKSNAFLENGKIKIPSINGTGTNNLTSSTIVERKNLDEKSLKADQKRLDSLIKMKNTYNQQKKAVQQSLSSIDTTPQNKKIIFDAPMPTDNVNEIENVKNKPKPLFDDDEDDQYDYEKNFEIKKQYEGEGGARLQRLQSKFQNDQRFNMNENFLDEDNEEEEQTADDVGEAKSDERQWQYDMLESVMGKKLQSENKKKSDNPMLRYDPTRNDHVKYEKVLKRKVNNKDADLASSKQMKLNDEADFEVSKEQFYNVTNRLTSALAPSSEGFSLLSMFGRGTDFVETNPKDAYKEILLTKGQQKSLTTNHTFNDESSDEEIIQERLTKVKDIPVNNSKQSNSKKSVKSDICHEPFFILGNDQRLLDGLSLFVSHTSQNGGTDEFESKQKEMRNIIKKKIKKSIKKVIPRHGKLNKRFGRLVKNS